MSNNVAFTVQYTIESCLNCNLHFGLPTDFMNQLRKCHNTFYCPACKHPMYYSKLSNEEILKRQLKDIQACCVEYEAKTELLKKSNRALKGQVTKLKKKTPDSSGE